MTCSHALLHCPAPAMGTARAGVWGDKDPGGVRVLLTVQPQMGASAGEVPGAV
jgi:hypothetical protein